MCYSQIKLKLNSPFCGCLLSGCLWNWGITTGRCPTMTASLLECQRMCKVGSGHFLGRGKAFLLFLRGNSPSLSRDKCWTEMERKKPRASWLSRRFIDSGISHRGWECGCIEPVLGGEKEAFCEILDLSGPICRWETGISPQLCQALHI